jgi:lysylphosphatidylglycerol synthetase-like protein (DUF2156 family)
MSQTLNEIIDVFLGMPIYIFFAFVITAFIAMTLLNIYLSSKITKVEVSFWRAALISFVTLLSYIFFAGLLSALGSFALTIILIAIFKVPDSLAQIIDVTIMLTIALVPVYLLQHKLLSKHIQDRMALEKLITTSLKQLISISLLSLWGIYFATMANSKGQYTSERRPQQIKAAIDK